jgi:hypothetical protein
MAVIGAVVLHRVSADDGQACQFGSPAQARLVADAVEV